MKKIFLSSLLIFALTLTMLSACGGGGGGSSSPPPFQPTTAVLTLSTAVTGTIPANTTINGYDVTITLPAGVTVKSTTPPQTDAGVVTDYPVGASMVAAYSAATGTIPGKVRILIAKDDGYYAGEFGKVNCDIAAGHTPTESDFQQITFSAHGYLHTHLGYPDDMVSDVDLTSELSLTATAVIN
jgi:hypothetical protein